MGMNSKKFKRVFTPPHIQTIFEIKRNPFDDYSIVEEWVSQAFEYSCMNEKRFAKVKAAAVPFVAYFVPHCKDIKRYEIMIKQMLGFGMIDDHTECGWGDMARGATKAKEIWSQALAATQKLLEKDRFVSMNRWKPYVTWWYMNLEAMANEMAEQSRKRLVMCFRQYSLANIQECERLESGHTYKGNMEDYFEMRRDSLAFYVVFVWFEYAAHLNITDEEWNHPLFQEYLKFGINASCCHNDIHSFEKEWIEHNKDLNQMMNSVALTVIADNCSVEEAMTKIALRSIGFEKKAKKLMDQLLEEDIREEMKTYVRLCQYAFSGNFIVGTFSKRYTKIYED